MAAGALLALPTRRCALGATSWRRAPTHKKAPHQGKPKASSGPFDALHGAEALQPERRAAGPARWAGQVLQGYNAALEANPVLTKALTSLAGFALGDCLAQTMTDAPFDVLRCLRLSTYGLLVDGPGGHAWYKLLDGRVLPDRPRSNLAVALKTALDQVVWAPAMTVVFFAVLKLLEGHPDQILATMEDKLQHTLAANYLVWPLMHWVNFKCVPPQYRVAYNNAIAVLWNAWVSWYCTGEPGCAAGDVADQPSPPVPALPCQHHRSLPFESGLAAAARQTAAVERLLASWGIQGLPGSDAGGELLQNYISQKGDLVQRLCGFPLHSTPPKF